MGAITEYITTTLKLFKNEYEAYASGKAPAPADYRARTPVETH